MPETRPFVVFIVVHALSGSMPLLPATEPPFTCLVTHVHDGDGPLWCADGPKVRVAGIQAPDFTSAAPCRRRRHPAYRCSDSAAEASKRTMERLVLHKRLVCQPVDRSYGRVVARCTLPDGRSLSCAAIAAGGAARWTMYWRRYGMGACRS